MKTLDYLEKREAIAIHRAQNVPDSELGFLYRRMATFYRRQIDAGLYAGAPSSTLAIK